ncbi:MAG: Holliday junction resolvase RecU [Clostridia bacterium]|nr:Holliday junction resolvase RecU [Clostridia bacterium]
MSWKSRGVRGSALEELIVFTNEFYQKRNLARVDKIPIPIKIIEQGKDGMINKAFYEKKSTVDFIGFVQGASIIFDAKETALNHLPFKNIHEHQIEYMKDITFHGGLAFIIVHFKKEDIYHLIPYEVIQRYYDLAKAGGRKSIPLAELNPDFEIPYNNNGILNYLKILNVYVEYKNTDKISEV